MKNEEDPTRIVQQAVPLPPFCFTTFSAHKIITAVQEDQKATSTLNEYESPDISDQ